jgi:ankyrin repeat protein/catechol 2,3-dioxygenase-like lactoylglutathione lyase family enzyme
VGDNTSPLHWAAAGGHLDVMRALLDVGGDVNGFGDVHEGDVIGWATTCPTPAAGVALLIERGARHHIFSAIALGDLELIRQVVEENPDALDRRRSRFEKGATVLHEAIERKRYDILDLLIGLGANLEAEDMNGRTALAIAMLHGDREAMRRLHAAGAKPPVRLDASDFRTRMARLASSVKGGSVTIGVPDVAAALAWYVSIGFIEVGRWEDDGVVNYGIVTFGGAELMFNLYLPPAPTGIALWFRTDRIDAIYEVLKARQHAAAAAALAGDTGNQGGIEFAQDIENMFYGARQFCIRDLNGYGVYFIQPIQRT